MRWLHLTIVLFAAAILLFAIQNLGAATIAA
jgi:hypothetical protein